MCYLESNCGSGCTLTMLPQLNNEVYKGFSKNKQKVFRIFMGILFNMSHTCFL